MRAALRGLAVVAALLFALPAAAEDCTSDVTQFNWNGVTVDGWSGCTASADDDFNIASGHTVTAGTDVLVTTGSVTVAAGGHLVVPPGVRLQYGTDGTPANALTVSGKLTVQGAIRKQCRVVSVDESSADTAAGAGTVTLTTDCDMTGVPATDFLMFLDEDPADASATVNGRSVHVGPGTAAAGVYRPSFNKWAWYNITGVAGTTITYELSSEETFASGAGFSLPYSGTRDWPTGTADPLTTSDVAEVVSTAKSWAGFSSSARIASGYGEICAIQADLGSYYGVFEESATGCPGWAFKVLHCERGAPSTTFDGAADVDDAAETITETGHDLRAGDPVRFTTAGTLPTPIVINTTYFPIIHDADTYSLATSLTNASTGQNAIDAAGGGGCASAATACTGGTPCCIDLTDGVGDSTLNGWVQSLQAATSDDVVHFSDDITQCAGDFHLTHGVRRGDPIAVVTAGILDGDGGGAGPVGSIKVNAGAEVQLDLFSMQNVAAATGTNVNLDLGTTTTAITGNISRGELWHFEGEAAGTDSFAVLIGDLADPGTSASYSGLTVDRLHIHDSFDDVTDGAGGNHGIVEFNAVDFEATRLRIERTSDDAAAIVLRQTTGGGTPSSTYRQLLLYEAIAGTDNSQECLQPALFDDAANDLLSVAATTFETGTITDAVAIGCYEGPILNTIGMEFNRLVASSGHMAVSPAIQFAVPSSQFSSLNLYTYASTGKNMILASLANSGATRGTNFYGDVFNSIFFGNHQRVVTAATGGGDVIFGPDYVKESVIDLATNDARTLWADETGSTISPLGLTTVDVLVRHDPNGTSPALCDFSLEAKAISLTHHMLLSGQPNAPNGWTAGCTNAVGTTSQIDGLYMTSLDAGNANRTTWNATGSSVQHICAESTHDNINAGAAANEAFTAVGATTLNFSALTPEADDDLTIRSVISNGRDEACEWAKPLRLGLAEVGVSHTMLGDGFIAHNANWSSQDHIKASTAGDGGGGVSGGGVRH